MDSSVKGFSWTHEDLQPETKVLVTVDTESVALLRENLPAGDTSNFNSPDADQLDSGTAAVVAKISRAIWSRLHEGPGLVILSGGGLDELADNQLKQLILGISMTLGNPMIQNPAGDLVVSVRDEARRDPQARGYRTRDHLPMHTDAADVTGLMCLHQGAVGGNNFFVSAEAVHDALCDEEPDLVPEFYHRWEWDRRGLEPPGEPPVLVSSIFSYYRGYLSCRYAPKLLRDGPARAGHSLTPVRVRALDCFDEIATRPALRFSWCLSRGESVWLNNYAVLHAREAFVNGGQPTSERHLLRTWVWIRGGRPLAPVFASPREVY